ncbi:MAG: hypothetical protein Q8Q02_05215 [Nocardioides sp.]|nr:hypothetical protein [Nocardioides sp.]
MPTPPRAGASRVQDSEAHDPSPAEPPLTSFLDLLAATECKSTAELDLLLYSSFDLEPWVLEGGPGHVVVTVRDRGVEVRFPCTTREFWEAVTLLEEEVRRRLEDAADDD